MHYISMITSKVTMNYVMVWITGNGLQLCFWLIAGENKKIIKKFFTVFFSLYCFSHQPISSRVTVLLLTVFTRCNKVVPGLGATNHILLLLLLLLLLPISELLQFFWQLFATFLQLFDNFLYFLIFVIHFYSQFSKLYQTCKWP
jgi:hypothetical protein